MTTAFDMAAQIPLPSDGGPSRWFADRFIHYVVELNTGDEGQPPEGTPLTRECEARARADCRRFYQNQIAKKKTYFGITRDYAPHEQYDCMDYAALEFLLVRDGHGGSSWYASARRGEQTEVDLVRWIELTFGEFNPEFESEGARA